MYIHLQNKMCRELEALEEKYRSGAEMSEGDLRKIDLLTHSMKSLATYIAMKEAEEYRQGNQMSQMNQMGQVNQMNQMSQMNQPNNSYTYNYDNNRMRPYYPEERRW